MRGRDDASKRKPSSKTYLTVSDSLSTIPSKASIISSRSICKSAVQIEALGILWKNTYPEARTFIVANEQVRIHGSQSGGVSNSKMVAGCEERLMNKTRRDRRFGDRWDLTTVIRLHSFISLVPRSWSTYPKSKSVVSSNTVRSSRDTFRSLRTSTSHSPKCLQSTHPAVRCP